MNPLDPENAAFRCWEHEDCLEHPGLAIACAAGAQTGLPMFNAGCDAYAGAWSGDGNGHGWTDGLHGSDGDGNGYGYCRGPLIDGRAGNVPANLDNADRDCRSLGDSEYTDYEVLLIREGMM